MYIIFGYYTEEFPSSIDLGLAPEYFLNLALFHWKFLKAQHKVSRCCEKSCRFPTLEIWGRPETLTTCNSTKLHRKSVGIMGQYKSSGELWVTWKEHLAVERPKFGWAKFTLGQANCGSPKMRFTFWTSFFGSCVFFHHWFCNFFVALGRAHFLSFFKLIFWQVFIVHARGSDFEEKQIRRRTKRKKGGHFR